MGRIQKPEEDLSVASDSHDENLTVESENEDADGSGLEAGGEDEEIDSDEFDDEHASSENDDDEVMDMDADDYAGLDEENGVILLSDMLDLPEANSSDETAKIIVDENNETVNSSNDSESEEDNSDHSLQDEEEYEDDVDVDALVSKVSRDLKAASASSNININTNNQRSSIALSLEAMTAALNSSSGGDMKTSEFKQRMEALQQTQSKSLLFQGVSKQQADRAERKAGYLQMKKEVNEWQTQVQENRMKRNVDFTSGYLDATGLAEEALMKEHQILLENIRKQKDDEENDFEKEINAMLKANKMSTEEEVMQSEQDGLIKGLMDNRLTIEEIKKRRQELAKLRQLMFYEERKNKRVKKIKSKLYRKIRRKHLDKLSAEHISKEELLNGALDPQEVKFLKESGKLSEILDEEMVNRARERMTLKHKNTSKFIKGLLRNGGAMREEYREAINEQLDKEQQLRRKVRNMFADDDSEYSDDLANEGEVPADNGKKETGLIAMKFMKNAEQRRIEDREDMQRGIDKAMKGLDSEAEDENTSKQVLGVRKFNKPNKKVEEASDNPFLTLDKGSSKRAMKETGEDNKVLISISGVLGISEESAIDGITKHTNRSNFKINGLDFDLQQETESHEPQQLNLEKEEKHRAVSKVVDDATIKKEAKEKDIQRELMRRAFVNAGVSRQQFMDEMKQKEEEKISRKRGRRDRDDVSGLEGWGSWAGMGTEKFKKPKSKHELQKDMMEQKRIANATKKLVKVDTAENSKKLEAYQIENIPFPFTSREQYEKTLIAPLGSDWNAMSAHVSMIRPAVKVAKGTIIKPLKKMNQKH